MAFETTNVRADTLGSLKVLAGDWSGVVGDADGTIVVGGSRVYDVVFRSDNGTTPEQVIYATNTNVTGTATTTTVTIPNRKTVTRGTFIIFYA